MRCRSWSCPRCRPRRQKQLRAKALAGNPVTFITLTCNPRLHESPGDAARAMSRAWRACRRLIEQEYGGRKGEYLTVVEATEAGWPHLHVLTTRPWIDQRWLSAQWERLIGAKIVYIERVKNSGGAARYVAKYLGKAPHRFLNCKRYYFTKGYIPKRAPDRQPIDWTTATHETLNGRADVLVLALINSGWRQIEAVDGFYLLEHPPPPMQDGSGRVPAAA